MDVISQLVEALTREKGYQRLELPTVPEAGALRPEQFRFVGIRDYWGSVTTIALVPADGLEETALTGLFNRYAALTEALQQHAGTLKIYSAAMIGSADVKLGSYGLLCLVAQGGCPLRLIEAARRHKRGGFAKKVYTVTWVLDVAGRGVHTHRWVPFALFPGKAYLQGLISRMAR
ncbi:MAG: hypothetical protein ACREUU_19935 [Gammaproteobacteria bacterium]